jgi:hypothetical protein
VASFATETSYRSDYNSLAERCSIRRAGCLARKVVRCSTRSFDCLGCAEVGQSSFSRSPCRCSMCTLPGQYT